VADSQDQGEKKPVAWPDDLVEDPVLVDLVGGVVRGRHKHSLGSQVGLDDDGGNSQEEVLDEDRDEHNKGLQDVAHRGLAENQTGGVDNGQDVEEGNEGVQGWLEPGGQHAVVAPANEDKHPGKEQERVEGDQKASPYYLGQWRSGGELILCAHVVIVPLDDGGNWG